MMELYFTVPALMTLLITSWRTYYIVDCPMEGAFYQNFSAVSDGQCISQLPVENAESPENLKSWKEYEHKRRSCMQSDLDLASFGENSTRSGDAANQKGTVSKDFRIPWKPFSAVSRDISSSFMESMIVMDKQLREWNSTKCIYRKLRSNFLEFRSSLEEYRKEMLSIEEIAIFVGVLEKFNFEAIFNVMFTLIYVRYVCLKVIGVFNWARKKLEKIYRKPWDVYECVSVCDRKSEFRNLGMFFTVKRHREFFAYNESYKTHAVAKLSGVQKFSIEVKPDSLTLRTIGVLNVSCIEDVRHFFSFCWLKYFYFRKNTIKDNSGYELEHQHEFFQVINSAKEIVEVISFATKLPRSPCSEITYNFANFCTLSTVSFYSQKLHVCKGLIVYSCNNLSDTTQKSNIKRKKGEFLSVLKDKKAINASSIKRKLVAEENRTRKKGTQSLHRSPLPAASQTRAEPRTPTRKFSLTQTAKKDGQTAKEEKSLTNAGGKRQASTQGVIMFPSPNFNMLMSTRKRLPNFGHYKGSISPLSVAGEQTPLKWGSPKTASKSAAKSMSRSSSSESGELSKEAKKSVESRIPRVHSSLTPLKEHEGMSYTKEKQQGATRSQSFCSGHIQATHSQQFDVSSPKATSYTTVIDQRKSPSIESRAKSPVDKAIAFRAPERNRIVRKTTYPARLRSVSLSTIKKPDVIRQRVQ